MSAAYRSLSRLPLHIFENLRYRGEGEFQQPLDVRINICMKLSKGTKETSSEPVTTVGALLKVSCVSLLRILDPLLTYEECIELRSRICAFCAPKPVSAMVLHQRSLSVGSLSTGIAALDDCLKGGFRMGTISELVGKAGAGKTQLAMQLCVVAAMNSIGTIYIDTEKKLSLERLREIANARAQSKSTVQDTENEDGAFLYHKDSGTNISHGTYKPSGQVLNNITIHSPTSTNELLAVIQNLEEEILLRNDEALQQSNGVLPVQLLVVDSIAAPTRRDFGADSAPQRVALLVQIAQVLKRLADQFNLAVVVINQVGSTMDQNYSGVRAALGTSWHHCLSTRVLMELETPAGDGKLDESFLPDAVRRATIVKSNVAGNTSMNYQISLQGLVQTTLST